MVEKKPEKTLATQAEFSRIVGATRQVISKAVKNGRLAGALRGDKIEIDAGVLEYHANKSYSKERGDQVTDVAIKGIMDRKQAAAYKEHYSALREEVAYQKDVELLVEKAQVIDEIFSIGMQLKRSIFAAVKSTKAVTGIAERKQLEEDLTKALRMFDSSEYLKKGEDATDSNDTAGAK